MHTLDSASGMQDGFGLDAVDVGECLSADSLSQRNAAFERLIRRYHGSIFRVALWVVNNHHDAEDVRQNVEIRAFQQLPKLRNHRAFSPWIHRMARRTAINHTMWSRQPASISDEMLETLQSPEAEVLQRLLEAEAPSAATLCMNGLENLPPDDREALDAFYIRHRSVKEMAEEFDAPVGTIKRRLFVARSRLRKVMEQMEVSDAA